MCDQADWTLFVRWWSAKAANDTKINMFCLFFALTEKYSSVCFSCHGSQTKILTIHATMYIILWRCSEELCIIRKCRIPTFRSVYALLFGLTIFYGNCVAGNCDPSAKRISEDILFLFGLVRLSVIKLR